MPLDILWHVVSPAESERVKTLERDLDAAQKDLKIALDKGQEVTLAFNQAVTERNAAQAAEQAERDTRIKTQKALAESIARERDLQAQIAKLTPPVVVYPSKVTRTQLGRWAGFTIEHSKKAPSPAESALARQAMDWGKGIGLDMFRIFLNPSEARTMSTMSADNPEHFIAYGRKIGLRWMADTLDTIAGLLPTPDALKAYCDQLTAMGCEGFYINDADRKTLPFEQLRALITRLRTAAPQMPIFVSLLGSANLDLYKSVADYVEIQTFGTLSELATFLKRGAIPCLDLRKPMTVSDLKARAEVTLRFPPPALYFYADLVTDYAQMAADENAVIRDFVKAWKAMG